MVSLSTTVSHRPLSPATPSKLLQNPGWVIAIGFVVSFALSWPHLVEVWTSGQFFDTDDAMRLVQIRAWLGGQGWYDLVAHRLDPPDGLLLHWSRVVDVAVGGLIRLFQLALPDDRAETLARIVFPVGLQLGLMAGSVWLGRLLGGPRGGAITMGLLVASGFMFVQFQPGRIHHEAPQITLLVAMTASFLAALAPGRARLALVTAFCLALSLAIGLELLPFIGVIVAILPLVWVFHPRDARPVLFWLAFGLVLFVPAAFVATVPPWRYAAVTVDAFSLAQLTGALLGAAGYAILASLSGRLSTLHVRAAALAMVGGAIVAMLLVVFPSSLRDPYAGMDPMMRRLWLSHVTEAEGLIRASIERPDTATLVFCPLLAGAVGLVFAVCGSGGLQRIRWASVLALTLVGLAGTFWEIRVATSTAPLALLGGVWAVGRVAAWGERRPSAWAGVLAWASALPFAAMAWIVVPTGAGDPAAAGSLAAGQSCRTPSNMAPLARLPAGLVFAPIDDGSHLLVHTPHTVLAAPYHRNERGNLAVLTGFLAPPASAEAMIRASGARYVAFCPGEPGITILASAAPNGLASKLLREKAPDWLVPIPLADTPYRVFTLR